MDLDSYCQRNKVCGWTSLRQWQCFKSERTNRG